MAYCKLSKDFLKNALASLKKSQSKNYKAIGKNHGKKELNIFSIYRRSDKQLNNY